MTKPPGRWIAFWHFIWAQLDDVILVVAGAVFAVGSYIEPVESFLHLPEDLSPIIVAMLALLAWSQIRSRGEIAKFASTWKSNRTNLFSLKFPQEYLDAQTKVSHSYFYSGATMQRTITAMREHLIRILSHSGTVRILLPDPDDDRLLEMIAETHPNKTAENIRNDILYAFGVAQALPSGKGTVALRTINFAPSIGINAMDVGFPTEMLMVQMYEFKGKAERAPIFILEKDDGPWFKHFTRQIDRLWDSGTAYPFDKK